MNQNTTSNQLFSRGHLPYVHEDSDNAAWKEQTALHPEDWLTAIHTLEFTHNN